MKKTRIIYIYLFCLVFFTGCSSYTTETDNISANDTAVTKNIEVENSNSFNATDLEGNLIDESFFENKVTLVNLWGTFCPPCIAEMPDLQKLSHHYNNSNIQVLGIITDTYEGSDVNIENAKEVVTRTGVEYINIIPNEIVTELYLKDVYSIPTSFIVDDKGNIISEEIIGARDFEFFKTFVNKYSE